MTQYPPPPRPHVGPTGEIESPKPQGLSLLALILGAGSFLLCFVPIWGPITVGLFAAIAAIVVGIAARRAARRGEQGAVGMAIAGLSLGAANLLLQVILIIAALALGIAVLNWGADQLREQPTPQPVPNTNANVAD